MQTDAPATKPANTSLGELVGILAAGLWRPWVSNHPGQPGPYGRRQRDVAISVDVTERSLPVVAKCKMTVRPWSRTPLFASRQALLAPTVPVVQGLCPGAEFLHLTGSMEAFDWQQPIAP
jgi:hypothetical protein